MKFITIEITDKCNLNCVYCYNHWKKTGDRSSNTVKSVPDLRALVSRVLSLPDITDIAFSGGEPFMAERFAECVSTVVSHNKQVSIISNGTFENLSGYKSMINRGASLFEIPFHSSHAAIHDEMVQKPGSWQKASDTIDFIRENGGSVVPVIVLTRFNIGDINETLQELNYREIHQVMINRYNIGGANADNPLNVLASFDDLLTAYGKANVFAMRTNMMITSNVCLPKCVVAPGNYQAIRFSNCAADARNMPITVDVSGNLRICNHSPIVFGNIFQTDLDALFNSEYLQRWRTAQPEYCSRCSLWTSCNGGCRAASEQTGGTLMDEDPLIHYYGLK